MAKMCSSAYLHNIYKAGTGRYRYKIIDFKKIFLNILEVGIDFLLRNNAHLLVDSILNNGHCINTGLYPF